MKNDELTWDKKIIFETIFSEAKFSPLKSMIEKIFTTIKEWMQSDEVKDIIKGLAEFQNLSVISQFGWCICDEELKNKISSEISLTKDRMDCLVISYYSENNYQKLKEKLAIWEKAPFLQERMPIIKSCLYASEKIEDEYLFNMAIPTLMAQEDGIFEDIYNLIPNDVKIDIRKTDHLNPNQTKKLVSSYLWYNGYGAFALYALKVLVEKTFLDGRKAIPSLTVEELEKYDKFRNKILHGDKNYLKYGTIKNYIQTWLELELLFLIYLAVININKKN